MFRVAILSFWHVHAEDYAREAKAHPDVETVTIWDENPARGRREAEQRNIPFHENLDELLEREDLDGVVVTTPTTAHRHIIPAAARAGKHAFTEKVIAPKVHEAQEIVAETESAGVTFTVSLPRLYAGYTRAIKEAIDSGLIGEPTYLRVRVSHDGALPAEGKPDGWLPDRFFDPEESAGGVTMDFGAHPLYLVADLLGMPTEVSAGYGRFTGWGVEDHSVVTMHYPSGALAVAEASFVGSAVPFVLEVHGTEGSLLYGVPDDRLRLRRAGTEVWEFIDVLPDGPTPFVRWVDLARQDAPDPENVRAALGLTALAEAAELSAFREKPVRVSKPVGRDDIA